VSESQGVGVFLVESELDSYNNTRSRSRIFSSDSDSRSPIGSFFTSYS